MTGWRYLFGLGGASARQRQRLQTLPAPRSPADCQLARDRLVVLDLETTGLDIRRDRILSAGAVVIDRGGLPLGEQFEAKVRRSGPAVLANVLIHGLSPGALAEGEREDEALLELLEFIGASPVFAFHAPFDHGMLRRALRRELGYRLRHPFIDVARLAPALYPDEASELAGLDDWLARFGLQASVRHSAAADAQATAELLLVLLHQAHRQGIKTLAELQSVAGRQSQLQGMRSPS